MIIGYHLLTALPVWELYFILFTYSINKAKPAAIESGNSRLIRHHSSKYINVTVLQRGDSRVGPDVSLVSLFCLSTWSPMSVESFCVFVFVDLNINVSSSFFSVGLPVLV